MIALKDMTWRQIGTRRAELHDKMKAMHELAAKEKRKLTAVEQCGWDEMDVEVGECTRACAIHEKRQEETTRAINEANATPGFGDRSMPKSESEWMDVRSGRPVPVFGPDQRIADSLGLSRDFRIGRLMMSKVTGDRKYLSDTELRALEGQTDASGGFLLGSLVSATLIDLARSKSVAIKSGVRTVVMEGAELKLAKVDTDPTVSWVAENTQLSETSPVLGQVRLQARTCRAYIPISAELMADSANASSLLEATVAGALGLALDKAILFGGGSGDGDEPIGIRNMSGTNAVASGGTLTSYVKFSDAVYQCQLNNAPEPLSIIYHPRTGKVLDQLADSTGQPMQPIPSFARAQKFDTTSISITESTDKSFAIVGPMSQVILGVRLNAALIEGPIEPTKYQRQFIAVLRADVVVPRPAMFTIVTGIS